MKKVLKGFSTRKDGSMYSPNKEQFPENVANRKLFFDGQGLSGKQVAIAGLVHGVHVEMVHAASPYFLPETDALITKSSDSILALTGADCFPIYFEEKTTGIIGLAHGGWRGIVSGIIEHTLAALIESGGTLENITLTIGPGICAKHFEIKEDILSSFLKYPEFVFHDPVLRVDLKGIMKKQAQEAGILTENIVDSGECTYCLPEKYFSYRRDKSEPLEAQIAYIMQAGHRKF